MRPRHDEHHHRLTLQWIRNPHGSRLCYIGPVERGGLDLRRSHPLAGDLDCVVGAAQDVPEPFLVDQRPIAVHPDVGPARPVRLQIALRVLPQSEGHAEVGASDHELPDLAPHRLALLVEDRGVDAGDRTREAAGL